MTQSIMKDPLKFPEDCRSKVSDAGIKALKGLLDKDPATRLGCRPDGQGIEDIRKHPWFAAIDWENIQHKEAQPPFVPDMKAANFDVSHELDEFLMVEKPLTHTKRKANADLDKLKPELRELEEKFTVYDFANSKRLSYYPHNQPIVTISTGSDTDRTLAPSQTATMAERSQAGSPTFDGAHHDYPIPNMPEMPRRSHSPPRRSYSSPRRSHSPPS